MLRKEQNDLVTQTGPGTPMGALFRCYWTPVLLASELAGERLPAGAGQGALRAAGRVSRQPRAARPDRRVLSPSRRVAVVRPQRGVRAALPLSRLEVRRHRPVRRGAVGAGGERLCQADQAEILSAGRARRRAVDLSRPARAPARFARMGIRAGTGRAALRVEAHPGMQLAAGHGGRHRFQPRLVPASRQHQFRSAVQGRQGQPVQSHRRAPGVRGGRERRRPLHRRAAQRRERQLLLARHPIRAAVLSP